MQALFSTSNRLSLIPISQVSSHDTLPKKGGYLHPPTSEARERLKQLLHHVVVIKGLLGNGHKAEFVFSLKKFVAYFASKVFPVELSLVGSGASFVVQGVARRPTADYDFRVAPIACSRPDVIHQVVSDFFRPLVALEGGEVHQAPNGMSISYKIGSIDLNFRSLRDRPVLSVNATDGFEVVLPNGGIRCVDQMQFLDKEGLEKAFIDGVNQQYLIHDAEHLRYVELRVLDKLTRGYQVSPPSYLQSFLQRLQRDYSLARPCVGWVGKKSFKKDFLKYAGASPGADVVFWLNLLAIVGVEDTGFMHELGDCCKKQPWSHLCFLPNEHLRQILLFVQMVLFCEKKTETKEGRVLLGPAAGSLYLLLWMDGKPMPPDIRGSYFMQNMDWVSRLCLKDARIFFSLKQLLTSLGVCRWSLQLAQIEEWQRCLFGSSIRNRLEEEEKKTKENIENTSKNPMRILEERDRRPIFFPSNKRKQSISKAFGILTKPVIELQGGARGWPSCVKADQVQCFAKRWLHALKEDPYVEAAIFEKKAQILIHSAQQNLLSFVVVNDVLQASLQEVISARLWTRRREDALLRELFLAQVAPKKNHWEKGVGRGVLEERCLFYSRCPDRHSYRFWSGCAQRVDYVVAIRAGLGRYVVQRQGLVSFSPMQRQAFFMQSMIRNAPIASERGMYALLPFCHSLKGKSVRDASCLLDFGRCWRERHISEQHTAEEEFVFSLSMLQLILHCAQQKQARMREVSWQLQLLLSAPLEDWKESMQPIYMAKFPMQADHLLRTQQEESLHQLIVETLGVMKISMLPLFKNLVYPVLKAIDKQLRPEVPTTPVECMYILLALQERLPYYQLFSDILQKRIGSITQFILQHLDRMGEGVELLFSLLDKIQIVWAKEQTMRVIKAVGTWPLLPRYIDLLDILRGKIYKEAEHILIESPDKHRDMLLNIFDKLTYDVILVGLIRQDPDYTILFMEQLDGVVQKIFSYYLQEFKQVTTGNKSAFSQASPVWRLINLFYDRFTSVFSIAQTIGLLPGFYYPISRAMEITVSVSDVAERLKKDRQLRIVKKALKLECLDKGAQFAKEAVRFYEVADRHLSEGKKNAARMAIAIYKLYCLQVRALTAGCEDLEKMVAPRIHLGSYGLLESFRKSRLKEEEKEILEINRIYWSQPIQQTNAFYRIDRDLTGMRPSFRYTDGKKGFRRKPAELDSRPTTRGVLPRLS